MKIGKIVTLLVLLFIGYQYQGVIKKNVKMIQDMYPAIQTYMEMNSYRSGLKTHISDQGKLPRNVSYWLTKNYQSKAKKKSGVDFFGTKYQSGQSKIKFYLRSCGRDKRCRTEDDLILVI